MKRILSMAAVAGMLALGGAHAPATVTAAGASEHDSLLAPLTVQCRPGLSPVAVAATLGAPGSKVPFKLYVNNVLSRSGWLTASATGVFRTAGAVVDNHRNVVRLQIINHIAVYGIVSPACTKPVVTTTLSSLRGSASSYALNHNSNGSVTRWNPCDGDIHVLVNASKGGTGALADAQAALAALSSATGLHFVYDGPTTFVPTTSNSGSQPAKIVIAWAPPGTAAGASDYFGSGAVGEGGWRSSGSSTNGGSTWNWKIVQGFVVLDPNTQVTAGFGNGISRGALLLHELAHAAGLDHTSDGLQVMYPVLRTTSYGSYGAGDLAGLKAVGATQGCTSAS